MTTTGETASDARETSDAFLAEGFTLDLSTGTPDRAAAGLLEDQTSAVRERLDRSTFPIDVTFADGHRLVSEARTLIVRSDVTDGQPEVITLSLTELSVAELDALLEDTVAELGVDPDELARLLQERDLAADQPGRFIRPLRTGVVPAGTLELEINVTSDGEQAMLNHVIVLDR